MQGCRIARWTTLPRVSPASDSPVLPLPLPPLPHLGFFLYTVFALSLTLLCFILEISHSACVWTALSHHVLNIGIPCLRMIQLMIFRLYNGVKAMCTQWKPSFKVWIWIFSLGWWYEGRPSLMTLGSEHRMYECMKCILDSWCFQFMRGFSRCHPIVTWGGSYWLLQSPNSGCWYAFQSS